MAELPGPGRADRALHQHRRRLHVLARRQAAPPDALPAQQRAARPRRPLPLRQRRRHRLEPRLEADEDPARPVRVPPRPRLHEARRRARRRRGGAALLRSPGRDGRALADDRHEHRRDRQGPEALLLRRVLLLRGPQRHDEPPADVLDRRGRGRGPRDLPHDRVPRAAQPLHAVRVHARDAGLRHLARRVRRRPQRPARGERPVRGRLAGEHRARLEPDRLARARATARAGRLRDLRVRARLRRPGRGAEVRAAGRREQGEGAPPPREVRRARGGRRRLRRAARDVGRPPLEVPGRLPGAEPPADAQHLEPVPVHDDVQPVALRQPLRDGDRARDGLPRLQPGPARLRPPRPRPRAAAHPRPRRHPARRRHLLPPVPAAHEEGERRDRRRLLRRPPLADPLHVRLRQGDGRHVDPRRARRLRRPAGEPGRPPPPPGDQHRLHARETAAPMGCR